MRFACLLAAVLAPLSFGQLSAHEAIYNIVLDGATESPPNASLGTGTGTVTVDLDLLTMRLEANFSGLSGATTASHIHCCTTDPGVLNAGVATQTPTFIDFPLNVTSGTYDHTFDMSLASSYNAAFITANGGTVSTAFSALLTGFDAGKAYLNIHSKFAPGGEIRGFLKAVPEPATGSLLTLGVAGLLIRRKRTS